jgi:hypothetical protein
LGGSDLGQRVLKSIRVWVGARRLNCLCLTLSHSASFASTLDTLVAVLVVCSKVFEKLAVGFRDIFTRVENLSESGGELLKRLLMEVVLMRLYV